MKIWKISEAVVRRLPVYLRHLLELQQCQIAIVSSQQLGKMLDLNPAQIRKDLAYFGDFGRKGIGYDVCYLIQQIRHILKLDQSIHVGLVGAGKLGHALCNYTTYFKDNIKIVAVFDALSSKIGASMSNLSVQPMNELSATVATQQIRIGIITVPAAAAQQVAEQFVAAGVAAILNFAPVILKMPPHVRVHTADFTTDLFSLAYYLSDEKGSFRS